MKAKSMCILVSVACRITPDTDYKILVHSSLLLANRQIMPLANYNHYIGMAKAIMGMALV